MTTQRSITEYGAEILSHTDFAKSLSKKTVPPGWEVDMVGGDGVRWINEKRNQTIIMSKELHDSGWWLHVSIAGKNRLPSYDDVCYMKHNWLGDDRKAIMVFPRKDEYVNIHHNCLHLYAPDGFDPLPDFRAGGKTI